MTCEFLRNFNKIERMSYDHFMGHVLYSLLRPREAGSEGCFISTFKGYDGLGGLETYCFDLFLYTKSLFSAYLKLFKVMKGQELT